MQVLRNKEDNVVSPILPSLGLTGEGSPSVWSRLSHARHSSRFGGISSRTDALLQAQACPILPPAWAWSDRAVIPVYPLDQTTKSFPVPERWALAPTSVSAMEIDLYIICTHFRHSAISATRKSGILIPLATDAMKSAVATPQIETDAAGKRRQRRWMPWVIATS
jgi:hypothetical protein